MWNPTITRIGKVLKVMGKELPHTARVLWKMQKVLDSVVDYTVPGTAIDHEWILRNQNSLEGYALEEMRKSGLIPVLDISPGLTYEYDAEKEVFNYVVTLKGIVTPDGRPTKAWGIMVGRGVLIGERGQTVSLVDSRVI